MVHVVFDPSSFSLGDFIQTGRGAVGNGNYYFEGIPPYQRGRGQRGAGVGAVFRGLWRYLLPVIRSMGDSVKQEGLATGSRILTNLSEGANLKDTILNEGKTGVTNIANKLLQKQRGSGYKRKRGTIRSQVSRSSGNIRGKPIFIKKSLLKKPRSDTFGLY